jgi:hypothetical protein
MFSFSFSLRALSLAIFVAILGLAGLPGSVGAEPLGTKFTYQGNLHFQSAPADGSYDFSFSLYADADGLVFVDGPLEVQDVPVSDGLFSVELDFSAVPFSGDARWLEVSVREGSSVGDFSQLLPRQEITASPYSLHAQMVAANAIGSVEIADGSVTSADLAGGAVTSAKIASDAVGSNEADATQVQLRVSDNCSPGSSIRTIGSDGTVTCEADDDTTYDGTDFALSNQGCVAGQMVAAIAADGTVTCGFGQFFSSQPTFALTVEGMAGSDFIGHTSIAITPDGLPVISYYHSDFTTNALKVAKCNDPACSGGGETLSLVDSSASVGEFTSIAIAPDGLPVISYYDRTAEALKVAKCNDAACSGSDETLTTVDNSASVGKFTSIAIAPDGLPVISYYDAEQPSALKVAKCNDAACSSASLTTVDDPANDVGQETSIAIAPDGLPVISYYDASAGALKVAKCNDAACSSGDETITIVDNSAVVGLYTSIAIAPDGLPVISYHNSTALALRVAKCNDAACSSATLTNVDDPDNDVGHYTSIAIAPDGLPVISHFDATALALKVAKCNDAACRSATLTTVDDPANNVGHYTSIAIAPDGLPVISYFDATFGALKVAKCGNLDCS